MKTFCKIFGAISALIVIAIIAVVALVDPNEYKPQIQAQVKQSINRELELKGDISWSFFPTLGFTTSEVYIQNPKGFNRDNLLEIKHISVALEIMPLLQGEINIGKVSLDGFRLNVITNANGVSNLDGMASEDGAESEPSEDAVEVAVSADEAPSLDKFKLGGLEITNAIIEIQDSTAKSDTQVTIKHITLGQFSLGNDTDFSMAIDVALGEDMTGEINLTSTLLASKDMSSIELNGTKLNTKFSGASLPGGTVSSSLSSNISYNLKSGLAKVNDIMFSSGEIELAGWASVEAKKITLVRFELAGNEWDLNPYMPSEEATASPAESTEPAAEPDLSGLNGLDVNGKFSLEGLKAAGLTLGKITSKIVIKNGKAKLDPLTANLYHGHIEVKAMVEDAKGRNRYQVTQKLSGIQIQPLMKDLADMDFVSGSTELNLTAKGQGLSVDKIKSQLIGNGDFTISDGSLYGINIPEKIRSAKAAFSGEAAPEASSAQQTDFTSLVGKFKINQGVFDNTSLIMASPLLRLNGRGIANIINETVNYKLGVTVVGSLEGQGGASDEQLSGLTIPLKVTGSFSDPKFGVDTSGALKSKLDAEKKKLQDKAKDKLDAEKKKLQDKAMDKLKDKLKDKLGGLFGN